MRDWRDPLSGIGLIIQLTTVIVVAILVPLGIGIFLDRLLHTSPFITLVLMVLGITLGTVEVYRVVNSVYSRIAGGKK